MRRDQVEALLQRKYVKARADMEEGRAAALAEVFELLGYLDPEKAKYLAPPTDPDVLTVLKDFP